MQILLIILFISVIISLVLLFSPLRLYISYSKENKLYAAFKLLCFKINIFPLNKTTSKLVSYTYKELYENVKELGEKEKFEFTDVFFYITSVISSVKYKITISELNINMTIGIKDAAETAIACGALYASIYGSIGALQNMVYINKPVIIINPVYNELTASANFKTELKAKIISIFIIAFKLSKNLKQFKKNKRKV